MKALSVIFLLVFISYACNRNLLYDLAIQNVTIIDGTGEPPQPNRTILIQNGLIKKLIPFGSEKFKSIKQIDATGKYVIPGLIDAHAHPNPIDTTFPQFIQFGVTSIMVPGCSVCTDEYNALMRQKAENHQIPAPRVFHTSQHFSMEGKHPQKTYPSPNWQHRKSIYFLTDTPSIETYVEEITNKSNIGIKVTIEDGPGPPIVPRIPQEFLNKIVKEAAKYDLEVFGHISDNEEWHMADQAGIQNLVHFVAIDIDFDRDAQLVQNLLDREVSWVTTLMLDKSFLYPIHPDWYNNPLVWNYFNREQINFWTSPERKDVVDLYISILQRDYGIQDPTLENVSGPLAADLKRLYDLGINICLGTDTGNDFIFPGYSLHEEMQLMALGGNDAIDIIRMATLNSAKMLQVAHELGSIEEGKKADFVILHKNPLDDIRHSLSIDKVFKHGVEQKRMPL